MLNKFDSHFILSEEELALLSNHNYLDEYPNILETMSKSRFTIADLKISPRDATYWDKQGILPIVKGPGLRRKYDLVQSVWIKLIQQMRSLGIGLPTIKKLKVQLLEPELDLERLLKDETLKNLISIVKSKLEETRTVEEILKQLKEDKMTIFDTVIMTTIIFRKHFQYLVNKDGEYIIYSIDKHNDFLKIDPTFKEFASKPHICLSVAEAYQSLVKEWSPEAFINDISILSKSELEILEMIRRKDVSSISIKYKNGEPDLIEVAERNDITIEQRFLDIIAKNGFHKITISTRNGKIVNYENKIQKKLNKSTK